MQLIHPLRLLPALLGFSTLLLMTACSNRSSEENPDSKAPRFAYVTNGIASFWVIAKAGAEAAGQQLGVDVSVHMPAEGIADQKRIVEDILIRGADGIAISPIDPGNQAHLLDTAAEQTHLITHDSDAPDSKRIAYVGMDNYLAGRMAGELVKAALPAGGTVAILIGRLEQDNARRRRQGVIDEVLGRDHDSSRYDPPGSALNADSYTIVGTLTDQFDRAKAKANCEDILSKHPDLGAMVGLFAYNPPACLEALRQQNKLGTVKVIGFDEADETLQAIQDGHCFGTVVQNPYRYGFESIRLLNNLTNNTRPLPVSDFLNIPARKITRDNLEPFWADLRTKLHTPATS